MTIEHAIDSAPDGSHGAVLRVRCTNDQAVALSRLLGRLYPGRRHTFLPLLGAGFTHSCSIPDTPNNLRRKWPAIAVQLLLGSTTKCAEPGEAPALDGVSQSDGTSHDALARQQSREGDARGSVVRRPRTWATGGTGSGGDIPPPGESASKQLRRARHLPAGERRIVLERLFNQGDASAFEAGLLLAQTLEEMGAWNESLAVYDALERQPPGRQGVVRAGRLRALSSLGKHDEVIAQVAIDESSPALRGLLGLALAATKGVESALAHLEYCWQSSEASTTSVALALARIYWQCGRYHEAAAPYRLVFDRAPADLAQADYAASDFAAIIELARLGEYDDLASGRLLDCLIAYCNRATEEDRASDRAHQLVLSGLEIGRRLRDSARLLRAYQLVVDDLLQRREGHRLVELIEAAATDFRRGLLTATQRFDILDAITDNLADYPQLLRPSLIENYEDLLRTALERDQGEAGPLPQESREIYRSLYDLDRRNPLCVRYRRMATLRRAGSGERADAQRDHVALTGKRVAIIGGHDSTRLRVRERLERWGVRVDEVAPATSGRVSEREILDRVRLSDLILLIVTYMGHDMSTIVGNLAARGALSGQVLSVDCRGATGVTRAIAEWADALHAR